ncbi:MAG: AraC family transcriptional regulator [Anaerostipes sp.]|nr:AraC family transcriptional regulator [Anaerostipes sp.]
MNFDIDTNQVEYIDGITHEFPYTMHNRDLTHFTVPWHWHEEVELDYVTEGAITIDTVNGSYTVKKGNGYFINTNVMDSKRKADGYPRAVECAHLFHPILIAGHFHSVYEHKYLNPILKNQQIEVLVITRNTATGKQILQNLKELTSLQSNVNSEIQIRNLLSDTWLQLIDEVKTQLHEKSFPKQYKQDIVRSMLSYIHQNYASEITLGMIADFAGISERECSRLFKDILHKTPFDFIIECRIEAAKNELLHSLNSVTNIALKTGFNNSSYFCKMFKEYTQQTPTEYRKCNK